MTNFATPVFDGNQLFVRYTHVVGLPREIHANGPMIPVDSVDPEAHAKAAPEEAEWFKYFQANEAKDGHSLVDGVPMYFLDATPEDYSSVDRIQRVCLRRSGMYLPFYPEQPHHNAVVNSW